MFFFVPYKDNPASTKEFFRIFQQFFSIVSPKTLENESERKIFFEDLNVPFLGMDEKDRLVLTGVRVANFLNIVNFDPIFYTTLINCLSVGLFICVCLYIFISVCLYVICTSVFLYLFLSVYLHFYPPLFPPAPSKIFYN
jgi:hypothetical protein